MRENRQVRMFAAATSLVLALLFFLVATPFLLRAADSAETQRIEGAARKARDLVALKQNGALRLRRFPDAKSAAWLSRKSGARIVVRRAAAASTRGQKSGALPPDFHDAIAQFSGNEIVVQQLSSDNVAAYLPLWSRGQSAKAPAAFVLRADSARREYRAAQRKLVFLGAALLFLAAPLTVATTHLLQRSIAARDNKEERHALPPPPREEERLRHDQKNAWTRVLAKVTPRRVVQIAPATPLDETRIVRDELAQTRHRLHENEETYRQMALSASDVLYAIYPGESRIDWLGQIDLMLGYAHGSFPRTVEAWADSIHPDEAERVIALYTQVCQSGETFSVEYRMRHRNGSYRDWLHRGKAVLGADKKLLKLVGSCSDITEKKHAERRLRESEERLARIIETVADAIVLCDRDGKITFANPAAELIFGASRDALIGEDYGATHWNLTRSDGAPLAPEELPMARVLASGESVHEIEQMFSHASGRQIVVSVNAAPLHDESGIIGSVISLIDVTSRKALEDHLSFRAFHDALTRLPNRALLRDRLEHALIRSRRSKTMVAMMFLDLDNFKKTNDTLGHEAGDALLIATAERLLQSLRAGDTAARFAGDEFTVMLDNVTDLSQVEVVANRILGAMLQPVKIGDDEVTAPPSIGVALGDWRDDVDSLLKRADETMYLAKRNGKARYEIHDYLPPRADENAPPVALETSVSPENAVEAPNASQSPSASETSNASQSLNASETLNASQKSPPRENAAHEQAPKKSLDATEISDASKTPPRENAPEKSAPPDEAPVHVPLADAAPENVPLPLDASPLPVDARVLAAAVADESSSGAAPLSDAALIVGEGIAGMDS